MLKHLFSKCITWKFAKSTPMKDVKLYGTDIKARMELMRHNTAAMTMRYSHLSVDYKRQAITDLPSFTAEMESQQISQQPEEQKMVAFAK